MENQEIKKQHDEGLVGRNMNPSKRARAENMPRNDRWINDTSSTSQTHELRSQVAE